MTLYEGSPCCNDLLLSEEVTYGRFGSNSDQMAYTVELVGVRAPPLPDTLCGLQLHLSHVMTSDMDFATQDTQRVLAGTCVTIVANAIPYARMSILPPATAKPPPRSSSSSPPSTRSPRMAGSRGALLTLTLTRTLP